MNVKKIYAMNVLKQCTKKAVVYVYMNVKNVRNVKNAELANMVD